MCLIVDANLCGVIFKKTDDKAYQKLRDVIFSNRLTIIHGGKLTKEYGAAGVLKVIALLSQSGKAYRVSDEAIDAQIAQIENQCSSNDVHIIALARSDRRRAHLLCTNDVALRNDFKNKSLISEPRGTIYSPTRHKASIANC